MGTRRRALRARTHEKELPMTLILAAILTALGMVVGFWLPDLDLKLGLVGLLMHRSVITHGWLLPLLCFWGIRKRALLILQPLAAGLSAAMAAHLCFDFFPQRWTGFALITIPLYGRTSPLFSQLWIALSIVICLYLLLRWVADGQTLSVVGLSVASSFAFAAQGSVYARALPLMTLIVTGSVALWLVLPVNSYLHQIYGRIRPNTAP